MSSNTIIRAARNKENPYAQIARSLFEDDRLSWRAKGLMGYLLSRKDDWRVYVADLQKRSTDGRDACYKALDELGRAGYLERLELRDKGRIKGYEYVIYEVASAERTASWKTVSGKTASGGTVSGNADTSNNLIPVTTEESEKERERTGGENEDPPQHSLSPGEGGEDAGEGPGGACGTEAPDGARGGPAQLVTAPFDPPANAEDIDATSTKNVPPGATAGRTAGGGSAPGSPPDPTRAALLIAFGPVFLAQLLSESPLRQGWLSLPAGRVAELHQQALETSGSRPWRTLFIAQLDIEVTPKPANLRLDKPQEEWTREEWLS